jgi:hypothetical protein
MIAFAFGHAILLNAFVLIPYSQQMILVASGQTEDIFVVGTVCFFALVITVLLQNVVFVDLFNWVFVLMQAI